MTNVLLEKINNHLDNVMFYQTVFSLPFAYIAAILAGNGKVELSVLFWITIVVFAARSAALGLDNLLDYKYDKMQPRLGYRPLVAGKITKKEIWIFVALCFCVLIGAVLQLQPICIKLLPLAAIPFIIYPFMKRITCFCHYMCGIAVAMAVAGGWVAVAGEITIPMIILYLAVALWIAGFDVAYGAQDEDFDKAQGLHSMAVAVGKRRALHIAKLTHIASLLLFLYFGFMMEIGGAYTLGVLISAGTLYYQHSLLSPNDFSAINKSYYQRNGIVSIVFFICTMLGVYL